MAKIVVLKAGVGDHTPERCPAHETAQAIDALRSLNARYTAQEFMIAMRCFAADIERKIPRGQH